MRLSNKVVTSEIDITLPDRVVELEFESSEKHREGEINLSVCKPASGKLSDACDLRRKFGPWRYER